MAWLREIAKPGRIAGKLARFLAAGIILCHAALIICVLFASIALSRWNPPVTALMAYRWATAHQKSRPLAFVPLRQIPRAARDMLVRLEDFKFYRHAGIDLGAIRDAYKLNRAIGFTMYGGSTIPQQLARTLFLTPRKTYLRKYIEALIAVEMDLLLSNNRLLELYCNYIEWGKGVYGIGAASAYYYRTGVGNLSLDELRRLVTIITNPLKYDVNSYSRSRQMAERYRYLLSRFPDPPAASADGEPAAAELPSAADPPAATPQPPE